MGDTNNPDKNEELDRATSLMNEWCECGNEDEYCFKTDNECYCGIKKHHWHCVCGKVLQVG